MMPMMIVPLPSASDPPVRRGSEKRAAEMHKEISEYNAKFKMQAVARKKAELTLRAQPGDVNHGQSAFWFLES